jgi:hypothetical protein
MSKKKSEEKPTIPTFADSVLKIGDDEIAKTYKDASGKIINEYIVSDAQKTLNDYYSSALEEYLPKINTLSEDYITSRDTQLDAYKQKGLDMIDDMYTPLLDELKNDVANRFGTLNSSSFLDGLNDIEDQRSSSMADLAESILAKSDELDNSELAKNYSFISFLLGQQNSFLGNAYTATGLTSGSSNLLNGYNTSNYNNYLKNYLLGDSEEDSNLPYIFRW